MLVDVPVQGLLLLCFANVKTDWEQFSDQCVTSDLSNVFVVVLCSELGRTEEIFTFLLRLPSSSLPAL